MVKKYTAVEPTQILLIIKRQFLPLELWLFLMTQMMAQKLLLLVALQDGYMDTAIILQNHKISHYHLSLSILIVLLQAMYSFLIAQVFYLQKMVVLL